MVASRGRPVRRQDGRRDVARLLLERDRELAVVERATGRAEVVVERLLHQCMSELEVPDPDLADQRRAHRGFDLVEHGELVELEHGRDHRRVELSTSDRRDGERTLRIGIEPSDSGAQHSPHTARHLDA